MKVVEAKIVVLGAQGNRLEEFDIYETFFLIVAVWDTAGQERFRSMAPMYYRNANAALLVYDITSVGSFVAVKSWVKELQR
ncbi:hypothetical protein MSG28_014894 [Choristoneura fumiferana]|uniref:Uncharacterized protein n=1 Tax=Choristoneura fumiferana TaxID=7141 RepID=A0ACC0KY86_CHOFU|nr:hypothetical protein MSG28_014894 [Choristoneura fumiferana]